MARSARVAFTKMCGTGNDFIIIDNREGLLKEGLPELAKRLCARPTSIGGDGLILVESVQGADFFMRVFNPDGTEPAMCGNGARCVARYAALKKIAQPEMTFDTIAGQLTATVKGSRVKLRMTDPKDLRLDVQIVDEKREISADFVDTGVPHVVLFADDLEKVEVDELGRMIRYHKLFSPAGTNVNFVSRGENNRLAIRTYERGVEAETLACGTGSTAAAVIAGLRGYVKSPVEVRTRGEDTLRIYFRRSGDTLTDVYLEGETRVIYEGALHREAFL